MPAPLILFLQILGGGAAFSLGSDMYRKGVKMVKENGPVVLGAIEDYLPEQVTNVLDPLDLFGARQRKEDAAAAAALADKRKALKKLSRKEAARRKSLWAKAKAAIADAEAKTKAALMRGDQSERAAAKAIADLSAARQAFSRTERAPEEHPAVQLMQTVASLLTAGGHPPDADLYQAPEYDMPGAEDYPEPDYGIDPDVSDFPAQVDALVSYEDIL